MLSRKLTRSILCSLGVSALLATTVWADNRIGGISTRSYVGTNPAEYLIAGVFVNNSPKKVMVRASGVDTQLNPKLDIKSYPDGKVLFSNKDWATGASANEFFQTDSGKWRPAKLTDSGLIVTLNPGLYTMEVAPEGAPGVGIIEVYELNAQEVGKLGGISTRSKVGTGESKMIAGVFLQGDPKKLIVRSSTIDGILNPRLVIKNYPAGKQLFNNDSWVNGESTTELQQLEKGKWIPPKQVDAAMIPTLNQGLFTFETEPESGDGIGLIEVYEYPCTSPIVTPSQSANAILNLGNAKIGESTAVQTINLKNTGCAPLAVNVTGTTGEISAAPANFNIAANATQNLSVKCTPNSEGMKTTTLKLTMNDPNQPQLSYNLVCSGLKKETLPTEDEKKKDAPKPAIFWSNTTVGSSIALKGLTGTTASYPLVIINKGEAELGVNLLGIYGASTANFALDSNSLKIAKNATALLNVRCSPNFQSENGNVLLSTTDPNQSLVEYKLECQSTDKPKIPAFSSSPTIGSSTDFGTTGVNSTVNREIIIQNTGTGNLTVDFLNIEGAYTDTFKVTSPSRLDIPPQGIQNVTVQCTPNNEGLFTANLKLSSNDPQNSRLSYPLSCAGKKVITCPSINFAPEERNDHVVVSLGFGYDKQRDLYKPQSCLNGTVTQVGGGEAKLDFLLVSDYAQLKKELGLTAELNVNAKVFKAHAESSFALNHQETKLSKSMVLKSEILLTQQTNQTGLNEFGKTMLNNGQQCFLSACGDSFIYQAKTGGSNSYFGNFLFIFK